MVKILVADDDSAIRMVVRETFREEGWDVLFAENISELRQLVTSGEGDLLLTDVLMPGGNGLDMIPEIQSLRPELPIIVMSAQNTLGTAIRATGEGAFDYLPKPFDLDELVDVANKALAQGKKQSAGTVSKHTKEKSALSLVGSSPAMQDLYKTMARVVPTELTVLIHGESGTGKELVAKALHEHGPRGKKPFVAVNMAAIPRELIESELFGHERGAFTGAATREQGRFGQAQGGTLFLDEIGDMPFEAQTRLLRVLQEGEYHAVGGRRIIQADVRIIAATHQFLPDLIKEKKFRQDLYYRLNVVPLSVPPLRERLEDITDLAKHFLDKATSQGLPNKKLGPGAVDELLAYNWPGNVRELENLLHRVAALYSEDVISGLVMSAELDRNRHSLGSETKVNSVAMGNSLKDALTFHLNRYFDAHGEKLPPNGLYQRILKEIEKPLIEKALSVTNGNQLRSADLLGLNRNTLRKKISDLKISMLRTQK